MAIDNVHDSMEASAQSVGKLLVEDVASVAPEILDDQIPKNSVLSNVEVKSEVDNDNCRGNLNVQSSPGDTKVQSKYDDEVSKISKQNNIMASNLQSTDHKARDAKRTSEAATECHSVKVHEVSDDPCLIKREQEGSNGSAEVQKSSEFKHSMIAEDHSKAEGTSINFPALTSQHKLVVCVGRSSLSPSNTLNSKSSATENLKSADAENSYPCRKQRVTSDGNVSIKKDRDINNVERDEEKHDTLRKTVREHSKTSVNSGSKMLHTSRISHATVSKRTMPDAKDSVSFSSSKLSSVQNVAVTSGSCESTGSLQSRCPLHPQNKMSTSSVPLKGEKLNQSIFQPPPKVNHAPSMHPPAVSNSTATLSDEEVRVEVPFVYTSYVLLKNLTFEIFSCYFCQLALLLHQELNSSPRVPRVPRVRHTGSLPQLSSPTATSILIKRTSSSGGKDHSLVHTFTPRLMVIVPSHLLTNLGIGLCYRSLEEKTKMHPEMGSVQMSLMMNLERQTQCHHQI